MISSDLKMYKALANGRMSGVAQVISGVLQNVFPHVTTAQRTAGHFDYFKTFWKVADDADGTLLSPEIYIDAPTASLTDYVLMFLMGQRDRVEDLTGYSTGTDTQRKYGPAYLRENIVAGAQTIVVTVKNAAMGAGSDLIFVNGDKIKLTDKLTSDAVSGNEEVLTINGVPVVDGTITTKITITVTELIANNYTAAGTPTPTSPRVSSMIIPGDLELSFTAPIITPSSSTGTLDTTTYPILLDGIGTVDEDWTIEFTDATHFTCTGDSLGVQSAGIISSDYAPVNADFAKPFFTIELEAWGGTWTAGDIVEFTTHPAAAGIGQKRVVPAASASLSNNKTTSVLTGETV